MTVSSESQGTLKLTVWPTFIGLGVMGPHGQMEEPGDAAYQRGQITWEAGDNGPVGHGRVRVQAGEYTHLVYAQGPTGPMSVSATSALAHPLRFTEAQWVDITDITDQKIVGTIQ